jgi:hypothetical protein
VGTFNTPAGAPGLFQVAEFQEAIQRTITHWSIATGRDVKSPTVAIAQTPIAPARSPSPPPNGRPAEPATV